MTLEYPPLWQPRPELLDAAHPWTLPPWWPAGRHPTHAAFADPATDLVILWSARDHRHGVHPTLRHRDPASPAVAVALRSARVRLWSWEPHNVSWCAAQLFFWGAWLFVLKGVFTLWPVAAAAPANAALVATLGVIAAVVLFLPAGYLTVVEAVNVGHPITFGYTMVVRGVSTDASESLPVLHPHHHVTHHDAVLPAVGRTGWTAPLWRSRVVVVADEPAVPRSIPGLRRTHSALPLPQPPSSDESPAAAAGAEHASQRRAKSASPLVPARGVPTLLERPFQWWGYRWDETGYCAAAMVLAGALLFAVSNIAAAAVPLSDVALAAALVWAPELIGSGLFAGAGALLVLEVQPNWLTPLPTSLGWHASVLTFSGGLAFLATGVAGCVASVTASSTAATAVAAAFMAGSICFGVGNTLKMLEVINRHVGARALHTLPCPEHAGARALHALPPQ